MSIFNLGVLKLNMSIGLFMVERVSRANRDIAMKKGGLFELCAGLPSFCVELHAGGDEFDSWCRVFHPIAPLGVDFHFCTCRGLHGAYENKQEGLLRR